MGACTDKQIGDLIGDFAAGRLEGGLRSKVVEHLATCAACQSAMRTVQWMSRNLDILVQRETHQHISTETLTAYADRPTEIDQQTRESTELHLIVCDQCREELHILRELNATLHSETSAHSASSFSGIASIVKFLGSLLLKPAFAYSVVGLLLLILIRPMSLSTLGLTRLKSQSDNPVLPREQGLTPSDSISSELLRSLTQDFQFDAQADLKSASPERGTHYVYVPALALESDNPVLLSEQARTTSNLPVIHRSEESMRISIGITGFWPDPARKVYSISIQNERGEVFFQKRDFTGFGDKGYTGFRLNPDGWPVGRYSFVIKAVEKSNPADSSVKYFPFTLQAVD